MVDVASVTTEEALKEAKKTKVKKDWKKRN